VISSRVQQGHLQLQRELSEERVAALRRIAQRLESLIDELRAAYERLELARGADRERELDACRDLRAQALKYRWYLEVQRESLGLRSHRVLDEHYRIPSPPSS
jgi:hypothetical protein